MRIVADTNVIASAVYFGGKCSYIVSGDNDLLDIKNFENIEIITVAQFLERLGK